LLTRYESVDTWWEVEHGSTLVRCFDTSAPKRSIDKLHKSIASLKQRLSGETWRNRVWVCWASMSTQRVIILYRYLSSRLLILASSSLWVFEFCQDSPFASAAGVKAVAWVKTSSTVLDWMKYVTSFDITTKGGINYELTLIDINWY
jgi:hypothetical protein